MFNPKGLYQKFYAPDKTFRGFPLDGLDQYYAFAVLLSNDLKIFFERRFDERRILDDKVQAPVDQRYVSGIPQPDIEYERPNHNI
jgi:hypothetical protein